MGKNARHTSCRHCGLDIEGFPPCAAGGWRDRGNNSTCPNRIGKDKYHEPVPEQDLVLGRVELLMTLEKHRNRGTKSQQVKQAIWQAEQAIRAMAVCADFMENVALDDPQRNEKFFTCREAWRRAFIPMEETAKETREQLAARLYNEPSREPLLTCHKCRHQQPRNHDVEQQMCSKCGSTEVWV